MQAPATRPTGPVITPGLRRYLYATAALTGGAIMIVEIVGARLLSPYVGTSHFVWTAQIAVTLVALATGYYAGGRLVDRSTKLSRLYWCILAAAVYLALTVPVCEPVSYWCLKFDLAVGSLMASAFLFFVPLSLLAVVGPFLVRVLTESLSDVGGNVGRLTAIGTLGSVAGTLLVSYVMIPFLPNSVTVYLTSMGLLAGWGGYFLGWASHDRASVPALMVFGIGAVVNGTRLTSDVGPHKQSGEIYRQNSSFGLMQVVESKDRRFRFYLNDYIAQNTYEPGLDRSISLFTYMLHELAQAYTTNISDVLCIGLGIGIVPTDFAKQGARVDVVEINPAVVPLAERYFGLIPTRLNLSIGDGRYFLNRCRGQYDVVVLDAFLGESSPSHLMTREAFAEMRRVLRPGGVLVINSFGDFAAGKDFMTASLDKTLKATFRSVRIHAHDRGNVFFVASDRLPLEILRPRDLGIVPPGLLGQARAVFSTIATVNPASGRILTDDFNPVEYFDSGNRATFRRRLAMGMKAE